MPNAYTSVLLKLFSNVDSMHMIVSNNNSHDTLLINIVFTLHY